MTKKSFHRNIQKELPSYSKKKKLSMRRLSNFENISKLIGAQNYSQGLKTFQSRQISEWLVSAAENIKLHTKFAFLML